jgi:hypothetical protein
MTAVFTAATLLLAGGAGLLTSLLVTPMRGARRLATLLVASVAAVGLGLLLIVGAPGGHFFEIGGLQAPYPVV